jgi:ribosomal protein S18 acetylase RimI-like enzyme
VEPLRPDQQRAAALTLAEAFAGDPLLEILAPDPARRVKLGPPMMSVLLAYGMRYGRVWSDEDASAVAIWLHPESGPMKMPRMLRAGMWRAPFMLGLAGMGRLSRAMSATEVFHKKVVGPHWYLMTVGTRTSIQGQGFGSTLVEMGTSRADTAGVPCYLETGTDSNIAFYRRRGFEVVGQADLYGHTLTGMVRPPRTPGFGSAPGPEAQARRPSP